MSSIVNIFTHPDRQLHLTGAGLVLVMLLTVLCYWPSLSGPFLFDDIPNLQTMGERGGLVTSENYVDFIFSGQAGPLGRPLSLATFTLDGQTWPTEARPFKVSNLIIHLFNGLLIFLLARQIFFTVHNRATAGWLALLCMTLWILHPLLVSTTAYVIQRMTQLGSLFTLTGLICYVHGRNQLRVAPRKGWTWIIGGMGVSGLLAVLSKESGVLLPLYALVIELTAFNALRLELAQRRALLVTLALPVVALIAYFAFNWSTMLQGYEFRSFTLKERLLTQAVVLVDYLGQIVVPQLSGLGIIHDDFPISKGLFNPFATALSLLGLATLFIGAWLSRKKWPLVSLGVLWFFAGHSLEAGPVALEIYFEHRNYLPLLGPVIALCSLLPTLSKDLRKIVPVVIFLFLCLEVFSTWQSARLWGNEELFLEMTAIQHPESLRAQQYLVNEAVYRGDFAFALAKQKRMATVHPSHTTTRLSILNFRCILGELSQSQFEQTRSFLARSSFDLQIVNYLGALVESAKNNTCETLGLAEVQMLLDAILLNPGMARNRGLLGAAHYQKGMVHKEQGELAKAVAELDLSYAARAEIDIRLRQIVWLMAAGQFDEAQRYLSLAQKHKAPGFWPTRGRAGDLAILQKQLDQSRGPD